MKKYLIGVALCSLIAVSCQKENALQQVDDVCTMMDDIKFMAYCYDKFDVNHDGKVSMEEANAVKEIYAYKEGILSFKGIEYFPNLTRLNCSDQDYPSYRKVILDVSKNRLLEDLVCSDNSITELDLSKNLSLEYLDCQSTGLTKLILPNSSSLGVIKCSNTGLTTLDVSMCNSLTFLDCSRTDLTTLDVSMCNSLTGLDCHLALLTSIDVSKNSKLTFFKYNPQGYSYDEWYITPTGWPK